MNSNTNRRNKTIKVVSIFFSFLVFILTIQSCAVSGMSSSQMTFRPNTTSNGLIFGTITFPKEKAKFNSYSIRITYNSADKLEVRKNSTVIQISPEQIIKMRHKGELDNGLTYLFAIERPEGDYEISSIGLFSNSGIAVLQKHSGIGGFSIPFKVTKGEIIYVGNVLFNEYAQPKELVVSYKNNFENDLAAIKKAQKYVYWDEAKNDASIKILYK